MSGKKQNRSGQMEIFFRQYQAEINQYLRQFFREHEKFFYRTFPSGGRQFVRRLALFVTQGKLVRGNLAILSHLMFTNKTNQEIIKAAAAIELFHSALLIHDDIMDRDRWRRGRATIYYQYQQFAASRRFKDPDHFGRSQGICAGDACFFLGLEIIAGLKIKPRIKNKIIELCTRELTTVGLAQMNEMQMGFSGILPTVKDIFRIYKYKTARYTFSLPLMIGALIAEQNNRTINLLAKLGERLGILFQIKDDELGLLGSEKVIGKPVGSDVKEGKKTLFYHYLVKKVPPAQRRKLKRIFGNQKINQASLKYVRALILESGVSQAVGRRINALKKLVQVDISALPVAESFKKLLTEVMDYIVERIK